MAKLSDIANYLKDVATAVEEVKSEVKPVKLGDAVASPLFRPETWQTQRAPELFAGRGVPVSMSEDLRRVLAIPRRKPLDLDDPIACEAMIEYQMRKFARPNNNCQCAEIDPQIKQGNRACIKRFLPVQAWMLYEIGIAGGLLAQASVGIGKTAVSILAALALPNCEHALLLVPPSLIDQLVLDYKLIAQHFKVPSLFIHTGDKERDYLAKRIVPDAPTLHVLAYSRLSGENSSDWIAQLNPQAIIADECDALKAIEASRTKRVLRHFMDHPNTMFCGWTGSLTGTSIKDFWHLAAFALRFNSPLPLDPKAVEEWGGCLDAGDVPSPPGALLELCNPGEDVRHAFHRRLAETPGFIIANAKANAVTGAEDGRIVELEIRERQAPPLPDIIKEALAKVRNFQRPDTLAGSFDDEELVDALTQAKCAREVACGVFYRWIFPRGEKESLIKEWYAARKFWNRELRQKLIISEQFLDSPKLCELAAQRAWGDREPDPERPEWKAECWPRWRDVRDLVEPQTQAVRLHPYLAQDAAQWGRENTGIIWYGMTEFAQWVAEFSGLPVHGGGARAGEKLRAERGDRSIIASIKSHGRGRDGLQHVFHKQLIANVPSSASIWEQLLGRTDRRGQRQDRVFTDVYAHVSELRDSLEQALGRGKYVEAIMGGNQKLLRGWRGAEQLDPGDEF